MRRSRKRTLGFAATIVAAGLVQSCDEEPQSPEKMTQTKIEQIQSTFDEAEEKAREISDSLADDLRERIKNLEEMTKDLRERATNADGPETRAILEESAEDLTVKKEGLSAKLAEVERVNDAAWESFRVELDKAIVEFKKAYDLALERAK